MAIIAFQSGTREADQMYNQHQMAGQVDLSGGTPKTHGLRQLQLGAEHTEVVEIELGATCRNTTGLCKLGMYLMPKDLRLFPYVGSS